MGACAHRVCLYVSASAAPSGLSCWTRIYTHAHARARTRPHVSARAHTHTEPGSALAHERARAHTHARRFLFGYYSPDDTLVDVHGSPPVILAMPPTNTLEQARPPLPQACL